MPSSAPNYAPNHCPKAPKSLCKHGDTTVPTIAALWSVAIQLLFISSADGSESAPKLHGGVLGRPRFA
jgi:hypothetical protein